MTTNTTLFKGADPARMRQASCCQGFQIGLRQGLDGIERLLSFFQAGGLDGPEGN